MKKYTYFVIMIVLLINCNKPNRKYLQTSTSDTLLSKTIIFPSSLLLLDGKIFQKSDSFLVEIKNKTKLVSIVDGNCMKCIVNQLNEIDSLFAEVLPKDCWLIYILNVNKGDSAFFMRNLQPAIKIKGVILWDNNYIFEQKNNLLTSDLNLRTFMVDKKNKISYYGNPNINPDVISGYREKLESRCLQE